jgi:hypothetical protein
MITSSSVCYTGKFRSRILSAALKGWQGKRSSLKRLISRLLKTFRRQSTFLRRALHQQGIVTLFATSILTGGMSGSATAIELSAVASGTGGFVINGIDVSDLSGYSVSGAGDVNGDGLADLIVGAYRAGPWRHQSGR